MSEAITLEAVLKRDRALVLAAVAGLSVLAWAYLLVLAWRTPHEDMAMAMAMPHMHAWGAACITSKKGVCYLTITIGRHDFSRMRIRHDTIDAQDKREMRRLYPDIAFDWKTIARQLAEKRDACREYRSRRRRASRPRLPREPFDGVVDPLTRTVYVNDPTPIIGVGVLLDRLMADERLR